MLSHDALLSRRAYSGEMDWSVGRFADDIMSNKESLLYEQINSTY